jgi:hypothetical protein
MRNKLMIMMLMLCLVLAGATVASAQVDDDDDDDNDTMADDDDDDDDDTAGDDDDSGDDDGFFASTVEFTSPDALDPNEEYEFIFEVTNNALLDPDQKGDWINQVDLSMPSGDYVVDENELTAPVPLYGDTGDETEIEKWEVSFDPNTVTITWQAFGVVTSANYGDIREGDVLPFQFVATTDSTPTGTLESGIGFNWVLYSDEGNTVSGTAYIGDEGPADDDDDDTDSGDDDDDSGGGCGC